VVSWWDDPSAQFAFFRPITSLSHYLDYRLWPDSPLMMHVHSLLWALAVFLGMRSLYRLILAPLWVARLALFIYVLDDARSWFVSWIAARNAVVATALSVWALVFYFRYRAERWRPGVWLGPLMFGLSLLAGEGSIAICAYLLAYALWLEPGPLRKRLLGLVPYGALVLVWRIAYAAFGYGVARSGLYADPIQDPWGFILALYDRAPVLLLAQFGGFWSDLWNSAFLFPRVAAGIKAGALLFIAAIGLLFYPIAKREPAMRFSLMGALLSVATASITFPSDRLLSWVSIGASIATASFIALYADARRQLWTAPILSKLASIIFAWLIAANLVMAPLLLPSRARGGAAMRDILDRANASIPTDPAIARKTVILVNPPGVPIASYLPIMRAVTGVPRPKAIYWLATSTTELSLKRIDAHRIVIRPAGGFLISSADLLFRSPRNPLKLGEQFQLGLLTIRVAEMTGDQRPAEAVAHFSVPLEDPALVWLRWAGTAYEPFSPPRVGKFTVLPAADYFMIFYGKGFPLSARLSVR
jgi:hypothetical protein